MSIQVDPQHESSAAYLLKHKPGKAMQKNSTVAMLLKIDPMTDFASFQNCLPPILKLQANLFGEHIPTEAEERAALEKFMVLYGGARSGFDRRKTDHRPGTARFSPGDVKPDYLRRKADRHDKADPCI